MKLSDDQVLEILKSVMNGPAGDMEDLGVKFLKRLREAEDAIPEPFIDENDARLMAVLVEAVVPLRRGESWSNFGTWSLGIFWHNFRRVAPKILERLTRQVDRMQSCAHAPVRGFCATTTSHQGDPLAEAAERASLHASAWRVKDARRRETMELVKVLVPSSVNPGGKAEEIVATAHALIDAVDRALVAPKPEGGFRAFWLENGQRLLDQAKADPDGAVFDAAEGAWMARGGEA